MRVGPLSASTGEEEIVINVGNRSQKPVTGTLTLNLPASWKTATPEIEVKDLQSGDTRQIPVKLTWSTDIQSGETASATFTTGESKVTQPIIPPQLVLHRAGDIKFDAQLNDWPENTKIPAWMLHSTIGQPDADIYLAWGDDGIYGALDVRDSKTLDQAPRTFWQGDFFELFLDTGDNKTQRTFQVGDHQFWLVPQPRENRVYVGRYKVANEIPALLEDIQGIKSACRKTDSGYVMEFMIPAQQLQNFSPESGRKWGLQVILTIHGQTYSREVAWPRPKAGGTNTKPHVWGTVELKP
jgi:hypothetical protein